MTLVSKTTIFFFFLFHANDKQNVNKLLLDAFQLHLPKQQKNVPTILSILCVCFDFHRLRRIARCNNTIIICVPPRHLSVATRKNQMNWIKHGIILRCSLTSAEKSFKSSSEKVIFKLCALAQNVVCCSRIGQRKMKQSKYKFETTLRSPSPTNALCVIGGSG